VFTLYSQLYNRFIHTAGCTTGWINCATEHRWVTARQLDDVTRLIEWISKCGYQPVIQPTVQNVYTLQPVVRTLRTLLDLFLKNYKKQSTVKLCIVISMLLANLPWLSCGSVSSFLCFLLFFFFCAEWFMSRYWSGNYIKPTHRDTVSCPNNQPAQRCTLWFVHTLHAPVTSMQKKHIATHTHKL